MKYQNSKKPYLVTLFPAIFTEAEAPRQLLYGSRFCDSFTYDKGDMDCETEAVIGEFSDTALSFALSLMMLVWFESKRN